MGGGLSGAKAAPIGSPLPQKNETLLEAVHRNRKARAPPHKSGLFLPEDALRNVLNRVPRSRVPLCAVCRTWDEQVAKIIPDLCVHYPKQGTVKLEPSTLLSVMVRFSGLQQLVLQDRGGPGLGWVFHKDVWQHLPDAMTQLQHLRVLRFVGCGIDDDNLIATARIAAGNMNQTKTPLLKLTVESCELVTGRSIVTFAPDLHKLSTLVLRQVRVKNEEVCAAADGLKALTSLDLRGCQTLSKKCIADELAGLHMFDVGGCTWVNDATLTAIGSTCGMLRELRIANCNMVKNAGVISAAKRLPQLRLVDLSWCTEVSGEAVDIIGEHCKRLVALYIAGCQRVDNKAVMNISANMPQLTHLSVANCPRVLDMGVGAIGRRCKNLSWLDVSNCSKVTDASVVSILQESPGLKKIVAEGTSVDRIMVDKLGLTARVILEVLVPGEQLI